MVVNAEVKVLESQLFELGNGPANSVRRQLQLLLLDNTAIVTLGSCLRESPLKECEVSANVYKDGIFGRRKLI
jgi:hypothetical protein